MNTWAQKHVSGAHHEDLPYPGDHCVDDYTRDRRTAAASRQQEEQRAVCVGAVVRQILDDGLSEENEMLEFESGVSALGRERGRRDDIPSARART